MGSDDFARKVFEKVFRDDIDRLRSMEDMWKTRKPPTALDFDKVSKEVQDPDVSLSQHDQEIWNLTENFLIFTDRHVSLNELIHS